METIIREIESLIMQKQSAIGYTNDEIESLQTRNRKNSNDVYRLTCELESLKKSSRPMGNSAGECLSKKPE